MKKNEYASFWLQHENLGLLRQQIKNTYTFKAKFQNFLVIEDNEIFFLENHCIPNVPSLPMSESKIVKGLF